LADASWVLLRASGTEPLLRLSLETSTASTQAAIASFLQFWIQQLL
jgi:phosphomannomutase